MSMTVNRWLLVGLIAVLIFAVVAAAQDDEEVPVGEAVDGQNIEEVTDGVDAEDAADELDEDADAKDEGDSLGVKATAFFPKYGELNVPAGERVEILVPVTNANANPTYEVTRIAGHVVTLDHQRFIQNFSVQMYDRKLEAGETATVKYSVTPDALIEPMEYAFVIAAELRTDDNATMIVTAFNGTMLVQDPLGFDFKGTFGLVAFFGGIAAAVYFYMGGSAKIGASAAAKTSAPSSPVETGTSSKGAYDTEFIDKSHLNFLQAAKKGRGRSASPKK